MTLSPTISSGSPPFTGAWIAIALAACLQLIRVLTVVSDNGETPFLSANDRSRWCTIATLMEDRSFIIDRLLEKRDHTGRKRTWYSIDMVRKPDPDGTEHYYSSKPPLLSVIYATLGSPVTVLLNHRLSDAPMLVGRTLLAIFQWLPLVCFWWLFARWIEKHVDGMWARWSLLVMILFGTFLSTFANTLNNHLPAALTMMASLWGIERLLRSWSPDVDLPTPRADVSTPNFGMTRLLAVGIGFFAGLAAAFELPALAWSAAVLGFMLLAIDWKHAALAACGMLPVGLAFAATNWIAYGDLQPPYAHREVLGPRVAIANSAVSKPPLAPQTDNSSSPSNWQGSPVADLKQLIQALAQAGITLHEPHTLRQARRDQTWELSGFRDQVTTGTAKVAVRYAVVAVQEGWSIHRWNDWYDYPKSYWLPENKAGVDRGEPSSLAYAFHVLIGHHGIFSLTPFWVFTLVGAVLRLLPVPDVSRKFKAFQTSTGRLWLLCAAIVATSSVCIAFYLARPLIDRNYGGVCSGFRWQFWLIPAWLWLAAPAVSQLSQRTWGRVLLTIAIALSLFSALYPWMNPWSHPWPYAWLQERGG